MTEGAQNDRGRERRFFASLRMTEKAQNDRGEAPFPWAVPTAPRVGIFFIQIVLFNRTKEERHGTDTG